jgi:hypothetical protein
MMKRYAVFYVAMVISVFILVMAAFVQSAKAASGAINMKEGLWEMTLTVVNTKELPVYLAEETKPSIYTDCLSQKEYWPIGKKETDCVVKDAKAKGNNVSWTVACKGGVSKATLTYAGTTCKGMIETETVWRGRTIINKTEMKGKYLGPCKK